MDFMPLVSPDLKPMDPRIFRDGKMGLAIKRRAPSRRQRELDHT
jgi:acyl CoA:acetate/3-ketoacid CoA transferase